jgi:predicted RNase H-like HicB family nuclease
MAARKGHTVRAAAKAPAKRRRPGPARRVRMPTPVGKVVFERSGKWWAVELPSFPGAYTQGKTQAEAYKNLLSLLRDLVEASAKNPPTLAKLTFRA